MIAKRDLIGADHLPGHGAEQVLGHRHQAAVVGIGLVELHHRELGVVLRGNPLVTEVAVDLEHPLEPADGQPLEVELGGDPEVQVHVERVVMRRERPRQRAAGNRLHHRRLDLEVAARRHELADRRDDAAAGLEDQPRVGVDDEIEVALPVADLDVGQAVPFLGQRQQAFGEEVQPRRPDRELVRPGPEQVAFDADPVAEVQQLEDLEVERRQRVLTDVDLNLGQAVGQDQEVRLAEGSDGENPAAGDRIDPLGFELVARPLAVALDELGNRVPPIERVRIDLNAELRQLVEVGAALLDLFVLGGHLHRVTSPVSASRPSSS